jgi:hypothetical protein
VTAILLSRAAQSDFMKFLDRLCPCCAVTAGKYAVGDQKADVAAKLYEGVDNTLEPVRPHSLRSAACHPPSLRSKRGGAAPPAPASALANPRVGAQVMRLLSLFTMGVPSTESAVPLAHLLPVSLFFQACPLGFCSGPWTCLGLACTLIARWL